MQETVSEKPASGSQMKFIIGGLLIIAAIILLIVTNTKAGAQYFLTVEELQAKGAEMVGREVRISGAVIGDSIQYDPNELKLTFTIAQVPGDNAEIEAMGGLAMVLHQAVENPDLPQLKVIYYGVKPDLLKNEAQAILTGKINADGIFTASELLLKCPTKYEEALPDQSS